MAIVYDNRYGIHPEFSERQAETFMENLANSLKEKFTTAGVLVPTDRYNELMLLEQEKKWIRLALCDKRFEQHSQLSWQSGCPHCAIESEELNRLRKQFGELAQRFNEMAIREEKLEQQLAEAQRELSELKVKYHAQELLYDQNQQSLIDRETRLQAAQGLVEKWRRDKRAMIFAGPVTGILQGRVEATQEHTDELDAVLGKG